MFVVVVSLLDFMQLHLQISITLNCDWAEPMTDSDADKAASQRFLEFQLGWFAGE